MKHTFELVQLEKEKDIKVVLCESILDAYYYWKGIEGQITTFDRGTFMVETPYFKAIQYVDGDTRYEIRRSALKTGKLGLKVAYGLEKKEMDSLSDYVDSSCRIDVEAWIADKSQGDNDRFLYRRCWESEHAFDETYVESTRDLLIITQSHRKQNEKKIMGTEGSIFNQGIRSWIVNFSLDGKHEFDFVNTPYIEVLQLLEACGKPITFEETIRGIVGHSIDIPCFCARTEDIEIVFCGDSILEIAISERAMENCYWTDSLEDTYEIKRIVKGVRSLGKCGQVSLGAAQNIWHIVYSQGPYAYRCGFCV